MVEGVTQEALDTAQEELNNNDVTNKFDQIENFKLDDLNSYFPENGKEETLDYAEALQDFKKGITFFSNKADEENDAQTVDMLKKIAADVQLPTNIAPAYQELEDSKNKVNGIINDKRQETHKLAEEIKNNYDGFIKKIQDNTNKLVKEEDFSAKISAPLFKADENTLEMHKKKDNPNEKYVKNKKKVIDGYVKALDAQSHTELNMSKTTYNKSKKYLQDLNTKIEKITPNTPIITYVESTKTTTPISTNTNNTASNPSNTSLTVGITQKQSAPKMLLAQNTNPSCTSCAPEAGAIGTNGASFDLSQFIKGIFTETKNSSGDKIMVNVVKSEQNIEQIGRNYISADINKD